ncbi:Hypothetical protein R9X50_00113800 [Acrodontium crateriforme]|uniref:Uncharacterized protein n=1 Tax=Acrodontium crateriforme TaxID=150365 RepID=A0AAQ3R7U6_9PEZI|nr:Hypothetical protein R9X50_00113800 [Acrodontium crateriforme]
MAEKEPLLPAEKGEKADNNDDRSPARVALAYETAFDWSNPTTWPLSLQFAPIAMALVAIAIGIYWNHFMSDEGFDTSSVVACRSTFNHTYYINAARRQAETDSKSAFELGLATTAIGELIDPEKTVFGLAPFPGGKIAGQALKMDQALLWMYQKIRITGETLFDDDVSGTQPAALGVAAVMIGQKHTAWVEAAENQVSFLLNKAPRLANGAISHLLSGLEVRAEDIYALPTFLAYYAVQANDTALATEAVRQISLYRDLLRINSGPAKGLWKHISSPSANPDDRAWSTANALAAYGILRTRASLSSWALTKTTFNTSITKLDTWLAELLNTAIHLAPPSGLIQNYLNDPTSLPETAGTALWAATIYRLAVSQPETYNTTTYLAWADDKRAAVIAHSDDDGWLRPAADPAKLMSGQGVVVDGEDTSAVAQGSLLHLSSAWRDCVCAGVCALPVEVSN